MGYILAFDIGGTTIKYGVLDESFVICLQSSISTNAHEGGLKILERISRIAEEVSKDYSLVGIGISTAGQVDVQKGEIKGASPNIPFYEKTPFKEVLESKFCCPVAMENDVNCVALAESFAPKAASFENVFAMTIGTGVGGAFIQNKKVYRGTNYIAGEIGYLPFGEHNFEEVASTSALVKKVAKLYGEELSQWDGKRVFKKIHEGDKIAIEAFDELLDNLATAILMIRCFYDPGIILIGGGISAQGDYFIPILKEKVAKRTPQGMPSGVEITTAYYMNDAGIIGAAIHLSSEL